MEQKSMSDNGNDFLDDMTQQQAEQVATEEPASALNEAQVETVEKPPETPAPEVTTTPEAREEQTVPIAALKAEREKRQAFEKELAELRAAQQAAPPQPMTEFYEAPEQHLQMIEQRATQRLYMALEAQAREVHPDYDEVFEEVKAAAENNPALQQRIFSAPNPALEAYRIGKQLREVQRMQDPTAFRAELEAELRAKWEAEQKAKDQARAKADADIPPDMTQARSAAAQAAAPDASDFNDLFPKK